MFSSFIIQRKSSKSTTFITKSVISVTLHVLDNGKGVKITAKGATVTGNNKLLTGKNNEGRRVAIVDAAWLPAKYGFVIT